MQLKIVITSILFMTVLSGCVSVKEYQKMYLD